MAMKINYVISRDNFKLFSFHRHDYNMDNGIFIDGGFDYTRSNATIHQDDIRNLIGDIREQFQWGQNYDKNSKRLEETKYSLLKDLTTDHVIGILIYFTERLHYNQSISTQWKAYHLIFLYELKYRYENKLE